MRPVLLRGPPGGYLLFQLFPSLLPSICYLSPSSKWDLHCAPKLFMESNCIFGGKRPRKNLSTEVIS